MESFPFSMSDIRSWIVKRKDGTVVRYTLGDATKLTTQKKEPTGGYFPVGASSKKSYSEWCKHVPNPENPPIFTNGKINLYIADYGGASSNAHLFDVAIDGGGVIPVKDAYTQPKLYGDPTLSSRLLKHVVKRELSGEAASCPNTKVLKIDWNDRCAPPLYPSFWPALLKELEKLQEKKGSPLNVVTICVGGHGRSGSALVALMMCMTDYSPLDALTHIRALHCARAIESKEQHGYLNLLARELGREENALDAEKVPSFKDRFLGGPFPEDLKQRIRDGNGAGDRQREAGYL